MSLEASLNELRDDEELGGEALGYSITALLLPHPDLSTLGLRGQQLGPKGVSVILPSLQPHRLTSLDLSWCGLGPSGAAILSRSLPSLARLTSLDLTGNAIRDRGISELAISIPALSGLVSLSLANNKIACLGIDALAPVLSALNNLAALKVQYHIYNDMVYDNYVDVSFRATGSRARFG
jgi:hypothetical protein